jgi:hypothetical protein
MNSVIQQRKPCSFLTAPCPGYHTDMQKYIRQGERGETWGIGEGAPGTQDIDLFWEQLIAGPAKNTIFFEAQLEKLTTSHY